MVRGTTLSSMQDDDATLYKILDADHRSNGFVCLETVIREFTRTRISAWVGRRQSQPGPWHQLTHDALVDDILANSRLVLAMSILGKSETLVPTLVRHGIDDDVIFDEQRLTEKCASAELTNQELAILLNSQKRIGAVIKNDQHQTLPTGTTLPLKKGMKKRDSGGSGFVFEAEVAKGHLKGWTQTRVALKEIDVPGNHGKDMWEQYYREVETLRKRRHPNIVQLLGSYYLQTTDSSNRPEKKMHLLFPWAESNLENWITSQTVPPLLRDLSPSELRAYVYRSIYHLASGLWSLHRESEGTITSHHDLKPRNILVFEDDLKIADLGSSHLRLATGGSETEGARGLGTYEYQPPEYWQDDGKRTNIRHGRAFDMWALGCIFIEMAILVVYDWDSGKVAEFTTARLTNPLKTRPRLAQTRPYGVDGSFHNNWSVVQDWIQKLKQHPRKSKSFLETLNVAVEMLEFDPRNRLYSWEAEQDLHDIQSPDDERVKLLEEGALEIPPPPKRDGKPHIPNGGQTPLHRAATKGNTDRLMDLISSGWPLFVQDQEGRTAVDLLKQHHDKSTREFLNSYLEGTELATDRNGGLPLLRYAETGDVAAVSKSISNGTNPLLVNKQGYTALFMAVLNSHVGVIRALLTTKVQEQLRHREKDFNDTPLHRAAVIGRADVVGTLLRYSPDIEDVQCRGLTPLFLAVEWNHEPVVQLLLDYKPGAQTFTQWAPKGTPLHNAVRKAERFRILRRLLNAEDASKCLEHKNESGDTPLWLAVFCDNFEAFRLLRKRGASLNVANNDKNNLLHLFALKGLTDFVRFYMDDIDAAAVEARNVYGETPLMVAEKFGRGEIANIFRHAISSR